MVTCCDSQGGLNEVPQYLVSPGAKFLLLSQEGARKVRSHKSWIKLTEVRNDKRVKVDEGGVDKGTY